MLIKNAQELAANTDANKSLNYAAIKMSIKAAEKKYIIPLIGMAQYTALDTAHNGGSPTAEQSALIAAIQEPLGTLALALFVPHSEVNISDMGVRRTGTTEMPGAFKYQVQSLQQALLDRGFDFIEDLLLFLETNQADYALWTNSEEFKEYRNLFVKSGTEFGNAYTGIKHPRQSFMKLRAALLFVQENIIRPAILPEIYDLLQEKLQSPTIGYTADDKILIKHIQRAMVYLSMKEGMNDYSLSIDHNGVTVLNDKNDNTLGDVSKKNAASDAALSRLYNSCHNIGYTWLKRATDFLDENASDAKYTPWYEKLQEQEATKDDDINENLGGCFSF